MNCEQMMEWMQRYVDEDLPQAEQDILMAHIKQCPDCAASFEQLQNLSAELSRLPMVSPPFSIVDSILPKLAELDTLQASIQVAYLPEKIPHKKSLFSWKMGAGFVAAAVFFSLIAVNLSPSSNKDASDMLMATTASKDAPEKVDQVQGSRVADQGKYTTDAVSPKASEAPTAATEDRNAGAFSDATDTAKKAQSTEAAKEKSLASEQPKTTSSTSKNLAKPEPTISVPFSTAVTKDSRNAKIAPAVPSPTPAPVPKEEVKVKRAQKSFAATEEASAPSLASDDGNFIGYVEQQTVIVRIPDGSQVYTSSIQWKPTDSIQLIKWEDNAHLTYEVTLEDGQLKRFVIDLILKTEQEQ
jgi:hypothetical protein